MPVNSTAVPAGVTGSAQLAASLTEILRLIHGEGSSHFKQLVPDERNHWRPSIGHQLISLKAYEGYCDYGMAALVDAGIDTGSAQWNAFEAATRARWTDRKGTTVFRVVPR